MRSTVITIALSGTEGKFNSNTPLPDGAKIRGVAMCASAESYSADGNQTITETQAKTGHISLFDKKGNAIIDSLPLEKLLEISRSDFQMLQMKAVDVAWSRSKVAFKDAIADKDFELIIFYELD